MSLLSEVLSSAETVELSQINTKVPEISSSVEKLKSDVFTYMENVYVKFRERPKLNRFLIEKLSKLQDEIADVKNVMEGTVRKNLQSAKDETLELLNKMEQNNTTISIVQDIYQVHKNILEIEELHKNNQYTKSMQKIFETQEMIESHNDNLIVIQRFSQALFRKRCRLSSELSNQFKSSIVLKHEDKITTIKIEKDSQLLEEVLSALHLQGSSIHELTSFLWHQVFVPLVDFQTEVKVFTEGQFSYLQLSIIDETTKNVYTEVFENLKTVVNFLVENLNFKVDEELTVLSCIGQDTCDNLADLLINHCLKDTIPSTSQELEEYTVVTEAIKELDQVLKSANIFTENVSLFEYINSNLHKLFVVKKCLKYIITASELMKKDLHDMVEVGADEDPTKLTISRAFPKCFVSKSVLQLTKLMEEILTQAASTSELSPDQLFCTVLNICTKYGSYVPETHKKLLQTIPQQIALFYNNCMFIAFKMTEWNETYLKKLPSAESIGPMSFMDEGKTLQIVACNRFTEFVQAQLTQVEETMKGSNLQESQTLKKLDASVEKSLRQCLRQQELLKTVWGKVLPYNIYNKTLGDILNTLCKYLIDSVIRFEDISTDAAEQLIELIKMMQTRGPKLFTDPKEVSLFCQSWYKLCELAFVLDASMVDINERWADGKGPLALHFQPDELKQLIRALFQNNERRAALLAKIRN